MGNAQLNREVADYIDATTFAVLAYVREDKTPVLRAMGSSVASGPDIYFSTRNGAAKVQEISKHPRISFFFEHDNQELPAWRNVLLVGNAEIIETGGEFQRAVDLLSGRIPHFKEQIAKGELPNTQIFKLKTEEIEYLDFGQGLGHVQKVVLDRKEPV